MTGAAASPIRIGTRGSDAAVRRAKLVQTSLRERGIESELHLMKTVGDKKLDEAVNAVAVGRFTAELEKALRAKKVDCCVHELDVLPVVLADALEIAAVLPRDDPRDVLVVNDRIAVESLEDLPRGSRVAAFTFRRRAQLLHLRSDIEIVELRGDAATRLHKVDDGSAHAAIFSAATLMRLGVHQRIDLWLEPPDWLPAAGQGAAAIEIRAGDDRMRELLAPLNHEPTSRAVRAERAFVAALGDGMQLPIAALATEVDGVLRLDGLVADARGRRMLRADAIVDAEDAARSGTRLAYDLIDRGAAELLAGVKRLERVPTPQPE
ncbi:MAG: hydroxymethylbilane synthase [Gemmatimonadota bacterium]|nr:hydroxymethylbilane synthase [Gemmatimonadota bacterium]